MTNTLRSIRRGPTTPERLLVLIPGYGDTPEPFLDRASMFDPNEQWLVVVVEPQTPSERGPYWYDVDENGPDPDALASALAGIDSLCTALLTETGLSEDELIIAGFSQGGALALAHLVDPTSTVTPRAVAALASYLPSRDQQLTMSWQLGLMRFPGENSRTLPRSDQSPDGGKDEGLATRTDF